VVVTDYSAVNCYSRCWAEVGAIEKKLKRNKISENKKRGLIFHLNSLKKVIIPKIESEIRNTAS
jgi:hypothetical protein